MRACSPPLVCFLLLFLFSIFEIVAEETPADPLLLTTVLVVEGKVFLENGKIDAPAGLKTAIDNQRLNLSHMTQVDDSSRYSITFFDPLQPVAQLGDKLKITITDLAGEIEETILTLTPADIVKGRVTLDIKTALLARTNHLQVNGRVCLSDGISSVGQGLIVSVEINDVIQKASTNQNGDYTLILTDQTTFLASTGDMVLATVELYKKESATAMHTLSTNNIISGRLANLNITTQLQQPVELILTEVNSTQSIVSPTIAFKDPNLERALRNQITANAINLGTTVPRSRLTEYHLAQLTELKAIDLNLFDLTGLSNCINLQRLNLSLNKISDLSIIGQIPTLTHLSLDNNEVKDLTPLAKLNNLVFLSLNGNQIRTLSPLEKLTQLKTLYCSHNQITKLSALENLKRLEILTLTGNYDRETQLRLADISPLTQLAKLKKLKLGSNKISDLTSLAKLTQLTEVSLSRNNLIDITPLSSLIQLHQLDLSHNRIADITSLSHLPQITKWLNLSDNAVRKIRPLRESLALNINRTQKSVGQIWLTQNPLNNVSITHDLNQLRSDGLQVFYSDRITTDIIPITLPAIESRVRSALPAPLHINQLTRSNVASIINLDFSSLGLIEVDVDFLKNFPSLKLLQLAKNPLSHTTIQTQVIELEKSGVVVDFGTQEIGHIFVQASEEKILAHSQAQTEVTIIVKDKNGQSVETALVFVKTNRGRVDSPATNVGSGNYITRFYSLNDPGLARLTAEIGNAPTNTTSVSGHTTLVLTPIPFSSQKSIFKVSRSDTVETGEIIRLFVKLISSDGLALPNRKIRLKVLPAEGISVDGYTPTDKYGRTTVLLTSATPGNKIIQAFSNKVQLQSEVHINVIGEEIRKPVNQAEKVIIDLSNSSVWADGTSILDVKITVLDANGQGLSNQAPQLTLGSCKGHKPTSVFKDLSNCQPITATQRTQFGQLEPLQDSFDGSYYTTYRSGLRAGKIQITATTTHGQFATETLRLESPAERSNRLFLSQVSENIYQTQTFQIHIQISNSLDLVSWKLDLQYDADKLAVVSVEEGDFLQKKRALFRPGEIKKGQIVNLGATSLAPLTSNGSGVLATITFRAIETSQTIKVATIQIQRPRLINNSDRSITSTSIAQHVTILAADQCDVNLDGEINLFDLMIVAEKMEQSSIEISRLDVNKDGVINLIDLILIGQKFGQPASAPSIFPPNLLIEQWIRLAHAKLSFLSDQQRTIFRFGILRLRQIQSKNRPIDTRLLANYPNPFNPSTWIPFQLSQIALVTLTIYDVQGCLIRKMSLGYLSAGDYAQPERAIYWNGQTENGESVSSGTYFYHLQAGNYQEMRKMVVLK